MIGGRTRGGGRHLFLLGGTGFSRHLTDQLEDAGYAVRLSVATSLGEGEVEQEPAGGVRVGRLDRQGLLHELAHWHADALVDATHPYAVEVSRLARETADVAKIPLLRVTRPPWRPPDAGAPCRIFASEDEVTAALLASGKRALFTVGAKGLQAFAGRGLTLAARVLPTPESVTAALAAGVAPADLIAAYPPYSVEFTAACLAHLGCSLLVSKESGVEGGLDEKLAAARLAGGELLIVARPAEPGSDGRVYHDLSALLNALEDAWKGS